MNRLVWLFAFCVVSGAQNSHVAADETKANEYFEKHVRPLLIERCLKCHSEGSENVGGNLLLDSRQGWTRGGDLGKAIVPGDPEKSLLYRAVVHSSDELEMPPDGKLSKHEIGILKNWIQLGAPDPRSGIARQRKSIDVAQGKRFWAFRPHHNLSISVPDESAGFSSGNELDRFLNLAKSAAGIRPIQKASKRVLIRRVTLALTGLLPEPEEVQQFVNDPSPQAYAKVVDRLLSSPRYGEKWGRHWLDVARYADSNGLDENIAHGNAWRYRDYVIRSWNGDKPYSTFVREQLAGDLIDHQRFTPPADKLEARLGTGFLSLGPKVLAEVDEQKMEMDIVDEQVDTVGRAFMAMTFGCARCHDHKFDPIRTTDYYALAGIFKSTRTMEHFKKIARWQEFQFAPNVEVVYRSMQDEELEKLNKRQERLKQSLKAEKDQTARVKLNKQIETLITKIEKLKSDLIDIPTAMGVSDYPQSENLPVHIRGSHLSLGQEVERGVPEVMADHFELDLLHSGRLNLAHWMTSGKHPLVARVLVNRIWRWHFGKGIVTSTDNFGKLGEKPSHPELLNWLANRFVADGWSVKNLHRLILMSETYQLSSASVEHNLSVDRENRLLWRFEMQRVSAEILRDTVLQTATSLNLKMGGSQLHVNNREFIFDHTSKDLTKYDARTRSVYLPVIRNHLYDVFQLFDYSDASVSQSDRAATTVAPQALFMMNSSLVKQAAVDFAERLSHFSTDRKAKLNRAYEIAFGRPISSTELKRDLEYLDQAVESGLASKNAWAELCHAILMSNEFMYLR